MQDTKSIVNYLPLETVLKASFLQYIGITITVFALYNLIIM